MDRALSRLSSHARIGVASAGLGVVAVGVGVEVIGCLRAGLFEAGKLMLCEQQFGLSVLRQRLALPAAELVQYKASKNTVEKPHFRKRGGGLHNHPRKNPFVN